MGEIQGLVLWFRNLCEFNLWFLVDGKDYLVLLAQLLQRPFDTVKDLPPLRVDVIRGRGEYIQQQAA